MPEPGQPPSAGRVLTCERFDTFGGRMRRRSSILLLIFLLLTLLVLLARLWGQQQLQAAGVQQLDWQGLGWR